MVYDRAGVKRAIYDPRPRYGKTRLPCRPRGFEQLFAWLQNRSVDRVHAFLEATGGWSEALASELHKRGHKISLVNPQRIRDFGRSEGQRTKTDKADAALIARFCAMYDPAPWSPPRTEILALQAFVRRRESLLDMRTQESNRLSGSITDDHVRKSIEDLIDNDTDRRNQRDLIKSVRGLGHRSAASITAEFPELAKYRDAKAVAAHAGLCPAIEQSGTSLSRSHLSRCGSSRLKRLLYFPTIVAMKRNPNIAAFAGRLGSRGKQKMVVIAAAMRKLLVLAYGVVKSGRPFDAGLTTQHGI